MVVVVLLPSFATVVVLIFWAVGGAGVVGLLVLFGQGL
jgi:hypothetical protein